MLPGIVKHKLNLITKSLLKDVKNELIISAEYIPENNDTYTTKCKLAEDNQTVFELNILCNSQSEAKKIAENWKANANEYYSNILNMVSNKD